MKHYYLSTSSIRSFQKQRVSLLTLVFLLFPLLGFAQLTREWVNVYPQAASTAAIVVGTDQQPVTLSAGINMVGFKDPALTKLNQQGEVLWKHQFEEEDFNFGNAENHLAQDAHDNIYVLGNSSLIKFSPDGEVLWEYDLSQNFVSIKTFEVGDDGTVYIAGMTGSTFIRIIKLGSAGNKVWENSIPHTFFASTTPNMSIAIGDQVYFAATEIDARRLEVVRLRKLDASTGNIIADKTIKDESETGEHYNLQDIRWHDSGNLYLFINGRGFMFPVSSVLVMKLNSNGEISWENKVRVQNRELYQDATIDDQGNVALLSGTQLSTETTYGFTTSLISNAGQLLWHQTYTSDHGNTSFPGGLALLPDGRVAVTGFTIDAEERQSLVFLLYNMHGDILVEEYYHHTESSFDNGLDLAVSTDGSLYLAGRIKQNAQDPTQFELLVLKYDYTTDCTTPDLVVTGGSINCTTNTALLTASTTATGATFSWSGPGGYASTEASPEVSLPGNYTVTVTVAENCSASATVTVLPASQASACYTLDFENEDKGLISSSNTGAGTVAIFGRKRYGAHPSLTYALENHAAIFDSHAPTGDDADLYTDDWGNILIINEDLSDVPNDNRWGGEIEFDFSAFGPVTMTSMKALDFDLHENNSWVYLYDADGNELHKVHIQSLGNMSQQVVDLGNTKGVMKMKVVLDGFDGAATMAGSGAIDDIKFCVEAAPCQEPTAENALAAYAAPTLFSDKTTITFEATEAAPYTVTLHDLRGNLISELANGITIVGETKEVEVDGTKLPNGMYIARIISGSQSKAIKLILRK